MYKNNFSFNFSEIKTFGNECLLAVEHCRI